MKTLIPALAIVMLLGCPDWESEREQRCRQLDASTDLCAGGGGGVLDAGPAWNTLPPFRPSRTTQTWGEPVVRTPVLLWSVPGQGRLFVVETRDGGFSLWRDGNNFAIGTLGPPASQETRWCSGAVSAETTLIGHNQLVGAAASVSIDNFDGGERTGFNFSHSTTQCSDALAQYRRADGGSAFLGARAQASTVRFERAICDSATEGPACVQPPLELSMQNPRVDEAVTDDTQHTWFSAAVGPQREVLVAVELSPDEDTGQLWLLRDAGPTPERIELSGAGASLHAAWLEGQTLWLSSVNRSGGPNEVVSWPVPASARLVDLVENRQVVVLVLTSAEADFILIHGPGGDTFRRLDTPGYRFKPTVAQLSNMLRVAGHCLSSDAGAGGGPDAGCFGSANNPVLEFATLPDGGPW